MPARVHFDLQYNRGAIDRRIFSGFLEHLGRSIYEGVYDPGNTLSDEQGFRRDVIAAMRGLDMPLVRYPGGNFVSCYDWKEGIGPKEKRQKRPDFAWHSIEPNTFGTDEFMDWCRKAGTAPLMAVNLGTGTAASAGELLEYCNLPVGTRWSDLRAAHGHKEPHAVKVWCLGNEMDGPWQTGHVPAAEYARRAQQAGKLMKGLDHSIELVLCGSSSRGMATYMDWERQTLEYCWGEVDHISAHRYSSNVKSDTAWFLAEGLEIERILEDYRAVIGYVKALKRSNKSIGVSFDEWNVWYRASTRGTEWREAPPLLEEYYNMEDALVCAQYLNAFIRNADLVKIACIAQLVNVIAVVMTRKEGLLVQSIYHPLAMFSKLARGIALTPMVTCPTYKAGDRGETPVLDVSASYNEAQGEAVFFLVNREQSGTLETEVAIADGTVTSISNVQVLHHTDPKAGNTWENPNTIAPTKGSARIEDGKIHIALPGLSFVAITAKVSRK